MIAKNMISEWKDFISVINYEDRRSYQISSTIEEIVRVIDNITSAKYTPVIELPCEETIIVFPKEAPVNLITKLQEHPFEWEEIIEKGVDLEQAKPLEHVNNVFDKLIGGVKSGDLSLSEFEESFKQHIYGDGESFERDDSPSSFALTCTT